jgi:hypothetical protein
MTAIPLQPSDIQGLAQYSQVKRFFTTHLDMQVNDIRGMMRLPLPEIGITGGCNFAAAASLCNLVSGTSKVLYSPTNSNAGSGQRFKEVLQIYFPWDPSDDKEAVAELLYDLVRNPLAHSLGVLESGSIPTAITKGPLTLEQIEELETSQVRPRWVPFTVARNSSGNFVSVEGLYWGYFRLLENLVGDAAQMSAAESSLS